MDQIKYKSLLKKGRDIDILEYINDNNLLDKEKDIVIKYTKNLNSYHYFTIISDFNEEMILFMFKVNKNILTSNNKAIFKFYSLKKRSNDFYLKLWNMYSEEFDLETLSITNSWHLSNYEDLFKIIIRINKVKDYINNTNISFEKKAILISLLNHDDMIKYFNQIINKLDIKDIGRFLITYIQTIPGEYREKKKNNLVDAILENDIIKKITSSRKLSIARKLKNKEITNFFYPNITPKIYYTIYKENVYSDDFDKQQLDELIDIFKNRTEKQLEKDVPFLLNSKLINTNQIEIIMDRLIESNTITKKVAEKALNMVLMNSLDYLIKKKKLNILPFVYNLLDLKPDNLLKIISRRYSYFSISRFHNSAHFSNRDNKPLHIELWNTLISYVTDFSDCDFVIYNKLKILDIEDKCPKIVNEWKIKNKWLDYAFDFLLENSEDGSLLIDKIQGLIKYKTLSISWKEGTDAIDNFIEEYNFLKSLDKFNI